MASVSHPVNCQKQRPLKVLLSYFLESLKSSLARPSLWRSCHLELAFPVSPVPCSCRTLGFLGSCHWAFNHLLFLRETIWCSSPSPCSQVAIVFPGSERGRGGGGGVYDSGLARKSTHSRPSDWFRDGQEPWPEARRSNGTWLVVLGGRLASFPLARNCWEPFCHYEPHYETNWDRTEPRQGELWHHFGPWHKLKLKPAYSQTFQSHKPICSFFLFLQPVELSCHWSRLISESLVWQSSCACSQQLTESLLSLSDGFYIHLSIQRNLQLSPRRWPHVHPLSIYCPLASTSNQNAPHLSHLPQLISENAHRPGQQGRGGGGLFTRAASRLSQS